MRQHIGPAAVAVCLGLASCASPSGPDSPPPSHIAGYTDDGTSVPVRPGPAIGARIPEVNLTDLQGNRVTLASLYRLGPIVVTFYRGGWCPVCVEHLREWKSSAGQLEAMGVNLIAITPHAGPYAAETRAALDLGFDVFTDHRNEAADRFRLRFSVDEQTREIYRGYGIDLAGANAAGTWDLPAPGTFVIDTNGVVRWAFADWDYTRRADPGEVIEAVREVLRSGATRRL